MAVPSAPPVGGQAGGAHDSAVTGRQSNTSIHHVLVVDVTARGAGLWQGAAAGELSVIAAMVYLSN
ncbi:MAG: hypothetical protein U0804_06680 [Gemmataceae bacterium]